MSEAEQYAVIRSGGKQFRVGVGDIVDVELLGQEQGSAISFEEVLFRKNGSDSRVGQPLVAGSVVRGELVEEVKGPKVIAFKYKRRKNYRRKVGHRQRYSRVKITEIV